MAINSEVELPGSWVMVMKREKRVEVAGGALLIHPVSQTNCEVIIRQRLASKVSTFPISHDEGIKKRKVWTAFLMIHVDNPFAMLTKSPFLELTLYTLPILHSVFS